MTSRSYSMSIAAAALVAVGLTAGAADAQVKCQRAIAKASAQYVQARAKSLGKCEVSKVSGKLPLATVCTSESKTAAGLAKQLTKLQSTIDKACGGANKVCGGGDDETAASVGWPATCPNFENGSCNNAIGPGCEGIASCLACIDNGTVDQAIALYSADLNVQNPIVDKTLNKCQQTVIKATQAFLNSRSKALQKCWDGVMNEKGTAPCPSPGDGKAVAAIDKAESKKVAAICKACGGADKACGGGDDLTPAAIGFPTQCSDVTPPGDASCNAAVTTLDDLVDCVDCVTNFKVDCSDLAAVPQFGALPSVCNPVVTTPTPTLTPCPTATPPLPSCPTQLQIDTHQAGSSLDAGWTGQSHDNKIPDTVRVTVAVSGCAGTNVPTCGECTITGPIENAGGAAFTNHRCGSSSSWKSCTSNADCVGEPGSPPCAFFFGAPLPLSNGAVPICVTNEVSGSLTGTANLDDGTSASSVSLISRVHIGVTVDRPCPTCESGVCSGGPRVGQACTVQGTSDFFGTVSLDCPPGPDGDAVGTVPVTLALSTGTQTRTLSAANPNCRAAGFTALECHCDTCQTLASEPCTSNAQCPIGRTCGGRRCLPGSGILEGEPCIVNGDCGAGTCGVPGQGTAPNDCGDAVCSPNPDDTDTVNEGVCNAGPFDSLCSFDTFRGCASDAECRPPGEGGICANCAPGNQICTTLLRQCFTDNGRVGTRCYGGGNNPAVDTCSSILDCPDQSPGTFCGGGSVTSQGTPEAPCGTVAQPRLATLFCVKQTNAGSVNTVAGLPGLARLTTKSTTTLIP